MVSPNAVVTLQKVAGDLGKPEQILEAQQDQLNKKLKLKDVTSTSTKVCGAGVVVHVHHPGTETARNEGLPETPHDSAAQGHLAGHRSIVRGDSYYVATVTVQTIKPDDPAYVKESEGDPLKGFQLLPPR